MGSLEIFWRSSSIKKVAVVTQIYKRYQRMSSCFVEASDIMIVFVQNLCAWHVPKQIDCETE